MKKLLVVDDDPDICQLLKVVLETYHFTVDIATNGQEALEHVRAEVPDVLADDLTDVCRITAVATEGLHQEGNARLGLDNEVEHDLVEVRAMIPAVALGDVDDLLIGRRRAVRAAIDMETGTIEMGKGRREP